MYILLLATCSNSFAKCLIYDDPISPCRYPSGDEWCVEYGSGSNYAYNDKCLNLYSQDKSVAIEKPSLEIERENTQINPVKATQSRATAPEDAIESMLAESINAGNTNKPLVTHRAENNTAVAPQSSSGDNKYTTAIIVIIAAIVLFKFFGPWLILFSLIGLIYWLVTQHSDKLLTVVISSVAIVMSIYFLRKLARYLAIKKGNLAIDAMLVKYIPALALKREQLSFTDAYGDLDTRQWEKEKDKFIEKKLLPLPAELKNFQHSALKERIDKNIDQFNKKNEYINFPRLKSQVNFLDLSPREFEVACASELNHYGWATHVTPATRDQGADIIARKNAYSVVLQCKYLMSSTVPNKAVQEVHAAKTYHKANYAAVVSNAQYSPSARQLAKMLSVELLHHDDLKRLDEIIAEQY